MPDYQKLYCKMFNVITDTIEELKKAQQEAEELYLQSCGTKPRKIRITGVQGQSPCVVLRGISKGGESKLPLGVVLATFGRAKVAFVKTKECHNSSG